MDLAKADYISKRVINLLDPFCERIEIAGSVRRRCTFVNDIDIVLIPRNQGQLIYQLHTMGSIKASGQKLIRVNPSQYGISLDIYIAAPETWATLLLIRTGSKQHNIKLCSLARRKGMVLHADGSGLEIGGVLKPCPTEVSIFDYLGLKYVPPEKRK